MNELCTQSEMDRLLKRIDWDDAFVKEIYFCSPTELGEDKGSLRRAETPGTLVVLVFTPNDANIGIELRFHGVTHIGLDVHSELEPAADVRQWKVSFWLDRELHADAVIEARSCEYRGLDREAGLEQRMIRIAEARRAGSIEERDSQ
ncbi:MAG: hypothetical protein SYC29_02090 [Planctomycetota bacterium]|nr:hypothetical protein [Planctomycetota bacterium]